MKKTFRNHPSIIIENIGLIGVIIFSMAFSNLRKLGEVISDLKMSKLTTEDILVTIIIIVIALLIVIVQVIRWKKTIISYDSSTIEISRNTLNKVEKTYAIKNISNINLEQNIFEQMFGTCKLKIDTNTAETANETDIKIVLKKEIAEKFKQEIVNTGKNLENKEEIIIDKNDKEDIIAKIEYKKSEINKHFIFSNFSVIIISVIAFISNVIAVSYRGMNFALVLIILPFAWGLIKNYQKYHAMKVIRKKDKIIIKSGLTTKNIYEIPLNKISGIKVKQNTIARLFGLYMVEVINIGMGDSKEETSVILLIQTYENIKQKLKLILPEYSLEKLNNANKHSKKAGASLNIKTLIKLICAIVILTIVVFLKLSMLVNIGVFAITILYIVSVIIARLLVMKTNKIFVDDKKVLIMNGKVSRKIFIINKNKIQQIKMKNGPLSKKHNIYHGNLVILSNVINRNIKFGYYDKEILEEILS